MLQSGFVNITTGLNMRVVSKDWCKTVDKLYCRDHTKKSCLAPTLLPTVTVKLPLNQDRLMRVNDFVENKHCQFLGGRLNLLLSDTKERISYPVFDELVANVWKRVTKVTVTQEMGTYLELEDIENLCRPILGQMSNLTSISCYLYMDVELILCLPNPEKLEFLLTANMDVVREGSDNWSQVFERCQSNLKILASTILTRGMELALPHGRFEKLDEIRIVSHYRDFIDDEGPENLNARGAYLDQLSRDGVSTHFPSLKRIEVPFCDDGVMEGSDWQFPRQLIRLTQIHESVQEMEINVSAWLHLSLDFYPILRRYLRTGSYNLRRLVINTGFYPDSFNWGLEIAKIWPNLRSLKIDHIEYVKRNGRGKWQRLDKLLKCTEC